MYHGGRLMTPEEAQQVYDNFHGRIAEYMSDPNIADFTLELATARSLWHNFVADFETATPFSREQQQSASALVTTLDKVVKIAEKHEVMRVKRTPVH